MARGDTTELYITSNPKFTAQHIWADCRCGGPKIGRRLECFKSCCFALHRCYNLYLPFHGITQLISVHFKFCSAPSPEITSFVKNTTVQKVNADQVRPASVTAVRPATQRPAMTSSCCQLVTYLVSSANRITTNATCTVDLQACRSGKAITYLAFMGTF